MMPLLKTDWALGRAKIIFIKAPNMDNLKKQILIVDDDLAILDYRMGLQKGFSL